MTFAPPRPAPFFGRPGAGAGITGDIDWSLATKPGEHFKDTAEGVSQSITGAIEKYGLEKEQQKKDKGTLKGIIQNLDLLAKSDTSDSAHLYAAEKAVLEDEELPLSQRLAHGVERLRGMNITSTIQGRLATTEATTLNNELLKELKQVTIEKNKLLNKLTGAQIKEVRAGTGLTVSRTGLTRKQIKQAVATTGLTEAQIKGTTEATLGAKQERLFKAGREPLLLAAMGQDVVMNGLKATAAQQEIDLNEALKGPAKRQARLNLKKTNAEINKINKEAKKLKKEADEAGISEREFKPVILDGVPLPNTYYGKGNTPYYVDLTNPDNPVVSAITGTPAEQRAEVRLRLDKSLATLGDMPAGQFEDFVGYGDPKRALSISQYVDVLDFGEELEDGEIHWTDRNTQKLYRFNKEKFPKPEELDEDTLEKVNSFLKARAESASLFESYQPPVGGGDDTGGEELDDELEELIR